MTLKMEQLFDLAVQEDALDIHAEGGHAPALRKRGRLLNVRYPALTPEEVLRLAESFAPKDAMTEFRATGYAEFGIAHGEVARFRVAILTREGRPGIVARRIRVVDGRLVKEVDDSTVYVVDRDVLRPVTWAAFRKLYADFRGVATVVAIPRHLVHEPLGDGTRLVKTKDDPAVWLVDNGRTKRHVVSFRRRGFVWPKVKIVKPEEIDFLPVGPRLE